MTTDEDLAADAAETPEILTFTGITACYATHCRFNMKNGCLMRAVEIAQNGQCMSFEVRRPEHIREYLEKRGDLEKEQIEQIMAEIEKKDAENVSH